MPLSCDIVDFAALDGIACPCGVARRAFQDVADWPGTVHVTEISAEARLHYHRRLTETYYFLECEPDAVKVLKSMFSAMKRTDPSAKAPRTPPGWDENRGMLTS